MFAALVYIQGRYTMVNIDNDTEENVTLELVKSGIFEFGVLLELLYQNLGKHVLFLGMREFLLE